jgi:hypothetical protein
LFGPTLAVSQAAGFLHRPPAGSASAVGAGGVLAFPAAFARASPFALPSRKELEAHIGVIAVAPVWSPIPLHSSQDRFLTCSSSLFNSPNEALPNPVSYLPPTTVGRPAPIQALHPILRPPLLLTPPPPPPPLPQPPNPQRLPKSLRANRFGIHRMPPKSRERKQRPKPKRLRLPPLCKWDGWEREKRESKDTVMISNCRLCRIESGVISRVFCERISERGRRMSEAQRKR